MSAGPLRAAPSRLLPRALGVALGALAACGPGPGEQPGATAASAVADDERLDYLLAPCAQGGYYDVNTADVPALLGYALQHGQRDALRRAKGELAALGAEGIEVARRIARESWHQPDEKAHVRNAIDVALLSRDPSAHAFLREAGQHPMEDLRLLALEGLAAFENPEDWELLREGLALSSPTFVQRLLAAMAAVDRARTADLILGWIEAGESEAVWSEALPLLAGLEDPAAVARCAALWETLPPKLGVWLCGPCARAGDGRAIAALRAWSRAEDGALRTLALNALSQAELLADVEQALRTDPAPEQRRTAAALLAATPERLERSRDALRAGLSDPDESVASTCLALLAQAGDEQALERALALLSAEGGGGVRSALSTLGDALQTRPDLARRAFAGITAELERSAHRPLAERASLYVALGRVPLPEAAAALLEQGDREADAVVQGQRGARWFALQAGNLGLPAHAALLERLARETDPLRRIDYLEALTLRGEDEARDRVLELIERDQLAPYELLYAAERLVRIGPAAVVAPALKRATLSTDQDDVRRALQCLLWSSYPGPSEMSEAAPAGDEPARDAAPRGG